MTQDTMRAEFDAFLHRECFQKPPDHAVDLAWCAWQSAVAATRERDAKLLETLRGQEIHETMLFLRCAAAIRSQP